MNDVHFVMLLVFLVVVDIMALNFEILHTVDWLKHDTHIVTVTKVANVISMAFDYHRIEEDEVWYYYYTNGMLFFTYFYYCECVLKILAEGPEQRLKSFTKWATGALADTAVDVQLIEGCPVVDSGRYGGSLSPRFSLIAPAGSTDALAEWQRRIVPEEPEMQSCAEEMV